MTILCSSAIVLFNSRGSRIQFCQLKTLKFSKICWQSNQNSLFQRVKEVQRVKELTNPVIPYYFYSMKYFCLTVNIV